MVPGPLYKWYQKVHYSQLVEAAIFLSAPGGVWVTVRAANERVPSVLDKPMHVELHVPLLPAFKPSQIPQTLGNWMIVRETISDLCPRSSRWILLTRSRV